MTDPQNAPAASPPPPAAPPPAAAPASAPPAPSPMSGLLAGLSQGEMMTLAGSALIVLGDLIFGIFLDYSFNQVVWVAAVLSLILVLVHNRPSTGLSVPIGGYRLALILFGALALLGGIRWLLFDLQSISGRNLGLTYVLGALVFYVGVALMAFGAYLTWRKRV